MPTLPPTMLCVVAPFAPQFSRRVWRQALVLMLVGGRNGQSRAKELKKEDRGASRFQAQWPDRPLSGPR